MCPRSSRKITIAVICYPRSVVTVTKEISYLLDVMINCLSWTLGYYFMALSVQCIVSNQLSVNLCKFLVILFSAYESCHCLFSVNPTRMCCL